MAFINTLYNLWPHGDEKVAGLRDGIAASAPSVFSKYGINTPLLVAHVMAQISHECGAGHDVVENLNYTASRMTQVWPGRFPTIASAQPYANNAKALANKVYNGRMGNRTDSDDGWNYRGRGASQTTGREGYERVAKATGLDVVGKPDLLIDPAHFLECGASDFINCGCLSYAKEDNVAAVSAMLNVGHIPKDASGNIQTGKIVGLSERAEWLKRWKLALGSGPVDFTVPFAVTPKSPDIPKPPEIVLPPPGQVRPDLAPTFVGRVADLFKPKGGPK